MTIIRTTAKKLNSAMNIIAEGIANDLRNELVFACPVDTGLLKNSIVVDKVGKNFIIKMNDYGYFVEFGTPPHIIRPKNGKALKFKVAGTTVFATSVNHPGTRPNPFIRTTINTKLKSIIMNNFKRHLT